MTRLSGVDFPPSDMMTPPCPHFEECGSCQLQHLVDETYRNWKEKQLHDLIASNNIRPDSWLPARFIGKGTRRRVTFKIKREGGNLVLGFNKFHEHEIAEIKECSLLTPPLQKLIPILPEAFLAITPKGGDIIEVLIQETDHDSLDCVITGLSETGARQTGEVARLAEICGFSRVSFRKDAFSLPQTQVRMSNLTKTSGLLKVDLPAGAFLQPSQEGEDALSNSVMEGLENRKLGKKDKIADLFSGCGTFAGRLLEKYSVHAIEGDRGMAESLISASKGHSRLTAEYRDLFKEPVGARELRDFKAVVFDPPRAGAKEQCQKLAKSAVEVIIGVSCNPATFARDTKILLGGGYHLTTLRMIDQFLWSTHTELVGVFEKR